MTRRAWCAALIALAAACNRGSSPEASNTVGGKDAGAPRVFTVSGVSFAGAVSFEDLGAVTSSPRRPIDGVMRHVYGPGFDVSVRFFVPAAIYHGPATYRCGAEQGKLPQDYAHCSITVEHRGKARVAVWTTEGAPSGFYGPLTGCDIVVSQDAPTEKSGTMTCALPFATASGGHPDSGKALTVSGGWRYRIL